MSKKLMMEKVEKIIASMPQVMTIYIYPFAPKELLATLENFNLPIKLLPCTLEGFTDTKALSTYHLDSNSLIALTPHLNALKELPSLQKLQEEHSFHLEVLEEIEMLAFDTFSIYKDILSFHKDFDVFDYEYSSCFTLFLRPHMFCPKDLIIEDLKAHGIQCYHQLHTLLKEPYFDAISQGGPIAREVSLSYLAFDLNVSSQEAKHTAQTFLDILSKHAYRRCSF